MKNGCRFAKLRKDLCFFLFTQQRKIFCLTQRTFSPKQTQYASKKDSDLRLLQKALKLENDEQLAKVKRSQLLGYMSQLKAQGRSPATIARKLAAIKAFWKE